MKLFKKYYSTIFTWIIGIVFIISAILKLISVDNFQLYIYSFNILDYNTSSLLTRVLIGLELSLGLGYILNYCHKILYYSIGIILISFTIFLSILAIQGNSDNCHCFGNIIEFSPIESIIKNILLIILLLFSKLKSNFYINIKGHYLFIILLITFTLPFFITPSSKIVQLLDNNESDIDTELFDKFITENPDIKWGDDTKIICFYGVGCKYCTMTAQIINQIIINHNLKTDNILMLTWGIDSEVIEYFKSLKIKPLRYKLISPISFLDMTFGEMPVIVINNEQNSISTFNMLNIKESDIINKLLISSDN